MKVERIVDNLYKVYLNSTEYKKLLMVANTFHKGNKALTINEAITEGLDVSLSVKALLEDTEFHKQHKCPYCDNPVVEMDKTMRGTRYERKCSDE